MGMYALDPSSMETSEIEAGGGACCISRIHKKGLPNLGSPQQISAAISTNNQFPSGLFVQVQVIKALN